MVSTYSMAMSIYSANFYFHVGTSTASVRHLRIERRFDAECGFLIGTFTPSIRLIFNLVSIYSTNL